MSNLRVVSLQGGGPLIDLIIIFTHQIFFTRANLSSTLFCFLWSCRRCFNAKIRMSVFGFYVLFLHFSYFYSKNLSRKKCLRQGRKDAPTKYLVVDSGTIRRSWKQRIIWFAMITGAMKKWARLFSYWKGRIQRRIQKNNICEQKSF